MNAEIKRMATDLINDAMTKSAARYYYANGTPYSPYGSGTGRTTAGRTSYGRPATPYYGGGSSYGSYGRGTGRTTAGRTPYQPDRVDRFLEEFDRVERMSPDEAYRHSVGTIGRANLYGKDRYGNKIRRTGMDRIGADIGHRYASMPKNEAIRRYAGIKAPSTQLTKTIGGKNQIIASTNPLPINNKPQYRGRRTYSFGNVPQQYVNMIQTNRARPVKMASAAAHDVGSAVDEYIDRYLNKTASFWEDFQNADGDMVGHGFQGVLRAPGAMAGFVSGAGLALGGMVNRAAHLRNPFSGVAGDFSTGFDAASNYVDSIGTPEYNLGRARNYIQGYRDWARNEFIKRNKINTNAARGTPDWWTMNLLDFGSGSMGAAGELAGAEGIIKGVGKLASGGRKLWSLGRRVLGRFSKAKKPPAVSAPANSAPANSAPANSAPANSAPANSAPANSAPAGGAPAGGAPAGGAPAGGAPAGGAPAGGAPAGGAPAGGAPAGGAPAGGAPAGGAPKPGVIRRSINGVKDTAKKVDESLSKYGPYKTTKSLAKDTWKLTTGKYKNPAWWQPNFSLAGLGLVGVPTYLTNADLDDYLDTKQRYDADMSDPANRYDPIEEVRRNASMMPYSQPANPTTNHDDDSDISSYL